jgi:hypothetical protein
MSLIERQLDIPLAYLKSETFTALRPETDVEVRETALWLNDILHRIHKEVR